MEPTTGALLRDFFTGRYDFAVDATLTGVIVGAVCGIVGVFLVLRQLSLVGDAAGHATLPGVAGAFLLTGSKSLAILLSGALVSALLSVAMLAWIERSPRTRTDAAVAIVLSLFFGVGVVLLSYAQHAANGAQAGLNAFLYGSAAAVARSQLIGVGLAGSVAVATVLIAFRPLALATFDPRFAASVGVRVDRLRVALLVALCLAVVVSIQAVGVVLVAAMLIIPASAARLVTRRLTAMTMVSAAIGAGSGFVGALASYLVPRLATGPAMVLVAALVFVVALAVRAALDRAAAAHVPEAA